MTLRTYRGCAYKDWPEDRPEIIFLLKWTGQDRTGDTFLVIFRTGQHFFNFPKVNTINIDTKIRTGDKFLGKNRTGDKIKQKWTGHLYFWSVLISAPLYNNIYIFCPYFWSISSNFGQKPLA